MKVDILFCVHNRLEFTRVAFANLLVTTDWRLVESLIVYDDESSDGSTSWIHKALHAKQGEPFASVKKVYVRGEFGGPVAIMNAFLERTGHASHFVKLDNDTMVPPGWLDTLLQAHLAHPIVDLIGIEPPLSRMAKAFWHKGEVAAPELNLLIPGQRVASCDAIGGIGLMRRECFSRRPGMKPFATYGGFTNWQTETRAIAGWIAPPLKVFLLDRLPFAPFDELSAQYEAKGWQRPWSRYDMAWKELWEWSGVQIPVYSLGLTTPSPQSPE